MKFLALMLGIIGWLLILSGKLFCLIKHPEWTNSQAFINLWFIWLSATIFCVSGIIVLSKYKKDKQCPQ